MKNLHTCTVHSAYLSNKFLIDEFLGYARFEVLRLEEPQEKLVHDLKVRPGGLKRRLILFRVKLCPWGIGWRG